MRLTLLIVTMVGLIGCTNSRRPLHGSPPGLEKWSQAVDFQKAGEEAVEVLQGYLRVDTINPPGNETRGAQYLKDELLKDGIEAQIDEFAIHELDKSSRCSY